MGDGRQRAAWDHTSQLLCLTANIHRGEGKRAYSSNEFHPYRQNEPKPEPEVMSKKETLGAIRMFAGLPVARPDEDTAKPPVQKALKITEEQVAELTGSGFR